MGKKGISMGVNLLFLTIAAAVVLVYLIFFQGKVFGGTSTQLDVIAGKVWFGECNRAGYSLTDENFKIITEGSRIETGSGALPFTNLISRCGRCVGKEGDEVAIYLFDGDDDGIPDECEDPAGVGPFTNIPQFKKDCEAKGGKFVYINPEAKTAQTRKPRCCLEDTATDYCKTRE